MTCLLRPSGSLWVGTSADWDLALDYSQPVIGPSTADVFMNNQEASLPLSSTTATPKSRARQRGEPASQLCLPYANCESAQDGETLGGQQGWL